MLNTPAMINLRNIPRRLYQLILDGIFPQNCIYCDGDRKQGGDYLCHICREEIDFILDAMCNRCGEPAEISYDLPDEFECSRCRKQPQQFDRARSLGKYDSILRQLIHHFKYQRQPGAMSEITPLLQQYFSKMPLDLDGYYVSPVPLHFKKMKERGFDQAFLIAQQVAKELHLPMANGLLRRIKETEPQAKKNQVERGKNIKGAFVVNHEDWVKGKNILIVDDVFTTGATANEAAKMLKKAKAGQVHVFTLARV